MKEDNGWFTLIQITIGAYICYFEYIMYLLMLERRDANSVRKDRQNAMKKQLRKIADFFCVLLNIKKHN